MSKSISFAEVKQRKLHVIHEQVLDLAAFKHPGGQKILEPWKGRDATAAFEEHHSADLLAIAQKFRIGTIDASDPEWKADVTKSAEEVAAAHGPVVKKQVPDMATMLNTFDFEKVAKQVMPAAGWAYYDSGACDEQTLHENRAIYSRVWFRPRVMVNVKEVDTRTTLLGTPSPSPVYVTATALARLADPAGEVAIVRACRRANNTIYMVPTLSSCSLKEMTDARAPGQTQWFQLYVNPNRQLTADLCRKAESFGCKGLFVTVDAPQLGRRERDMRHKAPEKSDMQKKTNVARDKGTSAMLSSFIDSSLSWEDLPWLLSLTKLPVILKGIQTGEDAVLAVKRGCAGIVVSNHGGRQLDYARSPLEALIEVIAALKAAGLRDKCQVFVDGSVRRGTDVFKLMCIGADGVGMGRAILHGLASYGEDGVARVLELMQLELESCFRQVGCQNLSQVSGNYLVMPSAKL